ncbi:MAG: hypothetical protein L0Y44_09105 [Phycisphaerales bacterium]|nr:hypothetical protein [Phycisphaerales bacterium]MCI0674219.1 hypothetical protein [Phycisphaerales bacterium]
MNSNSVPIFVGLNYHMNCVQVCVMNEGGEVLVNRGVCNDWQAIVQVVSRHGDRILSAIESCAGAADLAEPLVSLAGWSVHVGHPGYVSRMKQNPDKTDYSDARMLASTGSPRSTLEGTGAEAAGQGQAGQRGGGGDCESLDAWIVPSIEGDTTEDEPGSVKRLKQTWRAFPRWR